MHCIENQQKRVHPKATHTLKAQIHVLFMHRNSFIKKGCEQQQLSNAKNEVKRNEKKVFGLWNGSKRTKI